MHLWADCTWMRSLISTAKTLSYPTSGVAFTNQTTRGAFWKPHRCLSLPFRIWQHKAESLLLENMVLVTSSKPLKRLALESGKQMFTITRTGGVILLFYFFTMS